MTVRMETGATNPPVSLQSTLSPRRKYNRRASTGTATVASTISSASSKSRRRRIDQPMSFLEFIKLHQQSAKAKRKEKHRSCLKPSEDEDTATTYTRKQVRFATNATNRKVWTHVKEIKKIPEEKHPIMWFSEEEFQKTVEDAVEGAIDEQTDEDEYVTSMTILFKSFTKSKRAPDAQVQRAMKSVYKCAGARGLEMHLVAKARDFAQKHRDTVLETQDILKQNGLHMNKKGITLICKESKKFSTPSVFMAEQLAQFDAQQAKLAASKKWKRASRRNSSLF